MNLLAHPIFFLKERNSRREMVKELKGVKSTKICEVVFEKISQINGALLPTASAPQVATHLFNGLDFRWKRKKSGPRRKKYHLRGAPIGFESIDPEGCVNAFMQFIIAIPSLRKSFTFAPRSFEPFCAVLDQYMLDQEERFSVSRANTAILYRFFSYRLKESSLVEMLSYLFNSLYLNWNIYSSLQEALLTHRPTDIFLSNPSTQKQIFTQPDLICYELDAFIEIRSDGFDVNYVAFIKREGMWYSCDNERITCLRSNYLKGPLQRSVLLHYKRLHLAK